MSICQVGSHFQALFIGCAICNTMLMYVRTTHAQCSILLCLWECLASVVGIQNAEKSDAYLNTLERYREFWKNLQSATYHIFSVLVQYMTAVHQTTTNTVMDRPAQVKQTMVSSYQHLIDICIYIHTRHTHTSTSDHPTTC